MTRTVSPLLITLYALVRCGKEGNTLLARRTSPSCRKHESGGFCALRFDVLYIYIYIVFYKGTRVSAIPGTCTLPNPYPCPRGTGLDGYGYGYGWRYMQSNLLAVPKISSGNTGYSHDQIPEKEILGEHYRFLTRHSIALHIIYRLNM